jgi:hypothetical protein
MLKENNARKGFFEHGEFIAFRNALPEYFKAGCDVRVLYRVAQARNPFAQMESGRLERANGAAST